MITYVLQKRIVDRVIVIEITLGMQKFFTNNIDLQYLFVAQTKATISLAQIFNRDSG